MLLSCKGATKAPLDFGSVDSPATSVTLRHTLTHGPLINCFAKVSAGQCALQAEKQEEGDDDEVVEDWDEGDDDDDDDDDHDDDDDDDDYEEEENLEEEEGDEEEQVS